MSSSWMAIGAAALAALQPGDPVVLENGYFRDAHGVEIGRLANKYQPPPGLVCLQAKVAAIVTRDLSQTDPEYRPGLKCDTWEVLLPELVNGRA